MELREPSIKNKLSVLIVDDDDELRQFMRMKLAVEAPHLFFSGVEGGPECLEYLKTNPVDCIISDYQMPGMNGMELLLALRDAGSDIPFIFVTGQGNEEVAREAFTNGANDYFTKEFGFAHFARIINSVEQAVRRRDAERERRQAEDALRASQKYLQTIIDTEPECVKLLSPDGNLLMMNRAGLAMLEAGSFDEVKGRPVINLITPEYRGAFNKLSKDVIKGGSGTLEFDMVGLKGRPLRLETHAVPLRNENDEIIAVLGITRDITERKIAEDALEESQTAYRTLAENLPGIVYRVLLREGCRMRFFNKVAESITGYAEEELAVGEFCPLESHILDEDRPGVIAEVKRAVSENTPFTVEYRFLCKDGKIRNMMEQGTPIYGPDGKPLYIDGVIFDVTEIKKERDVLERQRSDFYAMVTHDLKSPLMIILGYADLISKAAQGAAGNADIAGKAKTISSAGKKLLRLADDFVAAAGLEYGGLFIFPEHTDVAGLLRDVKDEFEPLSARKKISFKADIPEDLPEAVLDRKHFERAVVNLLQNAINYTPRGGEVRLAAHASQSDEGGHLTVIVSDNGPGISGEEREKVFDKYYRSPRTPRTKGTGLGLAIVKAVAEAHGGSVEVESREGMGSTFRLCLPLVPPRARQPE